MRIPIVVFILMLLAYPLTAAGGMLLYNAIEDVQENRVVSSSTEGLYGKTDKLVGWCVREVQADGDVERRCQSTKFDAYFVTKE